MLPPELEVIKEIPCYKVILKSLLKYQIQQLLTQFKEFAEEEAVLLTASISDSVVSELGTKAGKDFIAVHDDVKKNFLSFISNDIGIKKEILEEEPADNQSTRKVQETPRIDQIQAPERIVSFQNGPATIATHTEQFCASQIVPQSNYTGEKAAVNQTSEPKKTSSNVNYVSILPRTTPQIQPNYTVNKTILIPTFRFHPYLKNNGESEINKVTVGSINNGKTDVIVGEPENESNIRIVSVEGSISNFDNIDAKQQKETGSEVNIPESNSSSILTSLPATNENAKGDKTDSCSLSHGEELRFNKEKETDPANNEEIRDSSLIDINPRKQKDLQQQDHKELTEEGWMDRKDTSCNQNKNEDIVEIVEINDDDLFTSDEDTDPDYQPDLSFIDTTDSEGEMMHDLEIGDYLPCPIDKSEIISETPVQLKTPQIKSPQSKLSLSKTPQTKLQQSKTPQTKTPQNKTSQTKTPHKKESTNIEMLDQSDVGPTEISSEVESYHTQKVRNEYMKRVWDKLHFCVFCEASSTNIRKHYFGPHKREPEVEKILSLPKTSKERNQALLKLRNSGDYKHNIEVLKSGKGTFITHTRKSKNSKPEDYLPCEDCLGFFWKNTLWKHRKCCPLKKERRAFRKVQVQAAASLLLPSSSTARKWLKENVLKTMRHDEITATVRHDRLILKLGEKHFHKGAQLPKLQNNVSRKMRNLGRLLIHAKRLDSEISSLKDLIRSEKFPVLIEATRTLCKYDKQQNRYCNNSLAYKLGHLLKMCAELVKSEALDSMDEAQRTQADSFLSMVEDIWTDVYSSPLGTTCIDSTLEGDLGDKQMKLDEPEIHSDDSKEEDVDIETVVSDGRESRSLDTSQGHHAGPPTNLQRPLMKTLRCGQKSEEDKKWNGTGKHPFLQGANSHFITMRRNKEFDPHLNKSDGRPDPVSTTSAALKKRQTHRLTTSQTQLLRKLFKKNVTLRRELKQRECIKGDILLEHGSGKSQKNDSSFRESVKSDNKPVEGEPGKDVPMVTKSTSTNEDKLKAVKSDNKPVDGEPVKDVPMVTKSMSTNEDKLKVEPVVKLSKEDKGTTTDGSKVLYESKILDDHIEKNIIPPQNSISKDPPTTKKIDKTTSSDANHFDESSAPVSKSAVLAGGLEHKLPIQADDSAKSKDFSIQTDGKAQKEDDLELEEPEGGQNENVSDEASYRLRSSKSSEGIYDDVHACLFCFKLVPDIDDHLIEHKDVLTVKRELEKRKPDFSRLRKLGDDRHNQKVVEKKTGMLIIIDDPSTSVLDVHQYGPCAKCREWMHLSGIEEHMRLCLEGICEAEKELELTDIVLKAHVLSGLIPTVASKHLQDEVYPLIKNIPTRKTAVKDTLILMLGESWLKRDTVDATNRKYLASQHMCRAAKLLISLREGMRSSDSDLTFWEFLKPTFFDRIVDASFNISLREMDDIVNARNMAAQFRNNLQMLVNIKYALILKNEDSEDEVQDCKSFLCVLNLKWTEKVSKLARPILEQMVTLEKKDIPQVNNIEKLSSYLRKELKTTELTSSNFMKISSLCQAVLMMYNKRRAGEIDMITLQSYESRSRSTSEMDESVAKDLTEPEKYLLVSQEMLTVNEKGDQLNPIIIPQELSAPLKFISNKENRRAARIPDSNTLLFASGRAGALQMRAYDSLKSACDECELKNPHQITSLNLRKYTATLTQLMFMDKNQFDWLYRHMDLLCRHTGNMKLISRDAYQQMSESDKKLYVTKLVLVLDLKLARRFKGRSLEDVKFLDILYVEDTIDVKKDQSIVESSDGNLKDRGSKRKRLSSESSSAEEALPVKRTRKSKDTRQRWTEDEVNELKTYFKKFLANGKAPGSKECEKFRKKSKKNNGFIWKRANELIAKKVNYMIRTSHSEKTPKKDRRRDRL